MINVDLRRYGTDEEYRQFINRYIGGAESVLGLKFIEEFKQYLVDEDHDLGHQYIFRFPNNYGASVIKNVGSYGNAQDLWEMALIFFDEDGDWHLTYERDFYDDVKGYLTDDNIIELLEKIKQY